MQNLIRRVLTGLVFIPLILALLYVAPRWGFVLFVLTASTVASWEFFGLSHPNDKTGRTLGTILSAVFFLATSETNFGATHGSLFAFACISLSPIALLIALFRPARIATALLETGSFILGPIYISGMMGTIPVIHATGTRYQGAGLVVFTLMIAWLSDTLAMFAGKTFGGPKLYPAASPNKTWAGSLGGITGSMLGGVAAHFVLVPALPLLPLVATAAFAGAFGQLGDLCESVLKRSAGVKDSGAVLPGHGGFLDRIDALTFAAFAVFLSLRLGVLAL
jgi:phosphatidate cytidylyltransferase